MEPDFLSVLNRAKDAGLPVDFWGYPNITAPTNYSAPSAFKVSETPLSEEYRLPTPIGLEGARANLLLASRGNFGVSNAISKTTPEATRLRPVYRTGHYGYLQPNLRDPGYRDAQGRLLTAAQQNAHPLTREEFDFLAERMVRGNSNLIYFDGLDDPAFLRRIANMPIEMNKHQVAHPMMHPMTTFLRQQAAKRAAHNEVLQLLPRRPK